LVVNAVSRIRVDGGRDRSAAADGAIDDGDAGGWTAQEKAA